MKFNVISFLPLLPRNLTTFLFALTALLRFYGNTETLYFHLTLIQWSLVAFSLAAAFLVVNISLEWNAGNRSRNQAIEARERETRRDDLADEERNKADQERERAEEERTRAENERIRSRQREARQDHLADEERNKADRVACVAKDTWCVVFCMLKTYRATEAAHRSRLSIVQW